MNAPAKIVVYAALLLAFFTGAADSITNFADLSYAEVKQHFEKDEGLEGISIEKVTASEITVRYKGRYLIYPRNKLTLAQKTKIDQLVMADKERRQQQSIKDNEEAGRLGMLREVDGVVYNLMKPTAEWITFNNVRVIQKTEDALLVDISKAREYTLNLILVKNLPQFDKAADNDRITFMAKQAGTVTYMTHGGTDKTVRQYDCGTLPGKAKPTLVRTPKSKDAKSQLDPSWDSSGTGFFITEDGYLVTCHHVVEHGKRVAIKTSTGMLAAKVIATDPTNDVAILKVSGSFTALPVNTNTIQEDRWLT